MQLITVGGEVCVYGGGGDEDGQESRWTILLTPVLTVCLDFSVQTRDVATLGPLADPRSSSNHGLQDFFRPTPRTVSTFFIG